MKIKPINIVSTLIFAVTVSVITSCGRFSLYDTDKGAAIVSVEGVTLYEDDLANIYANQLTHEDSVKQREVFIDLWIKNQVREKAAENGVTENLPKINELVATYRNSLIAHEFEEQFVAKKLDTMVTNDQVERYYKEYIDNFRLAGSLVKARIARVPSGLRQSEKLAKMFYSSKTSDYQDFINICNKNDYKVVDFTNEWVDFSSILYHIPFTNTDFDAFLKSKSQYEVEDDRFKYLMKVEGYLLTGSSAPIESQRENIVKILLHNRRAELIEKLNDSLYREAMVSKEIEFY